MPPWLVRPLAFAAGLALLCAAALPARADCPTGCDDGNPCTYDTCDPQLGCIHAYNNDPCTDGNACTTNDTCNGGACVGGNPAPGCSACDAVATLPAEGAVVLGQTSGASSLQGTCGDTYNHAPERVFKWTPTRSGQATFRTCSGNTNFDTALYVRSGSCTGPQLVCNDDGPCVSGVSSTEASSATVNVAAGTDYFIVVDGWSGSQPGQYAEGSFQLSVFAPSICGDNVRDGIEECDGTDHAACLTGQCRLDCTCDQPQNGQPDLKATITDFFVDYDTTSPPGDVAEGCAEAPNGIDLLRFGVKTSNIGTADMEIGPPNCPAPCTSHPLEICGNPSFICSPAAGHNHGHYQDYALYELVDQNDQAVVVGHKQGFCLKDGYDAGPCPRYKYDCDNQGISVGCSDWYDSGTGCQYLDVTGLPGGTYTLRVSIDPVNKFDELDETNNIDLATVTLPTSACAAPTVIPPGGGSFPGSTAGENTLVGSCGPTGSSPEKVYSFTPTASGTAIFDTCDASATAFDTVLYVRGSACKTGTELACNNDTAGCGTTLGAKGSRVSLGVTAGQTYYVAVDGASGGAGSFALHVTPPAGTPQCSDGLDNNGNTLIDHPADPGCKSANDPSENFDCADGVDNDGDGLIDFPADPGCLVAAASENPECNDGIDNDGRRSDRLRRRSARGRPSGLSRRRRTRDARAASGAIGGESEELRAAGPRGTATRRGRCRHPAPPARGQEDGMTARWPSIFSSFLLAGAAGVATAGLLDSPAPLLPGGGASKVVYRMGPVYYEPGELTTVIRCTNLGDAPLGLAVEIFDADDKLVGSASRASLAAGADVAFGTGTDAERPDLVVIDRIVNLRNGKARVSASSVKLSCVGQQVLRAADGTSRVLGLELVKKVAF